MMANHPIPQWHSALQNSPNFFLIAGPCAIEGRDIALQIADHISSLCKKLHIPYIFKGSYRKANRSRLDSFTGIGDDKALSILQEISTQLHIPVTTDIHETKEVTAAAQAVDILQIPAFLCRQTDLLVAAAKTQKVVNIKKGQFMAPESMAFAVKKVNDSGNDHAWLTERGTTFGYQDLVIDFRGIPVMQQASPQVILDCTHSLQQPNQSSGITGGRPKLIETVARAGIAIGVNGLFIETHPNPSSAKSDGANMLPLDQLAPLLHKLTQLRATINAFN